MQAVMVAGNASGAGKTSVALGLMAALKRRGLTVQGFKAGPDFIDPGHHAAVTGRASHNLDAWMCPPEAVRGVFGRYAHDADVCVVEGVMGLFDGAQGGAGSTAELAALLGLPVLLVLDGRGAARSLAATALGFLRFQPDLAFAGVVVNKVGGPGHAELIREAFGEAFSEAGLPLMGLLPRREALAAPERHLGLATAQDHTMDAAALADWVEEGIHLDALQEALADLVVEPPSSAPWRPQRARVGVARDAAFCFYYAENLRLLEAAGAELVSFSPLAEAALPKGLDGLYLGGGYPELHAAALAANSAMRREVSAFAASGRPVYAECGGLMYLCRELQTGGASYPMCGVFDHACAMDSRFRALGYRRVQTLAATPLGPAGSVLWGHEFHYSHLEGGAPPSVYAVTDRKGRPVETAGLALGETLASYVHLHWAGTPGAAAAFVEACRQTDGRAVRREAV